MQADNFVDAQYDQMIDEEELLAEVDELCFPENLKIPKVDLNTLNPPNVHRIAGGARNEFYDYQFMQWLSCSIRHTFTDRRSLTSLARTEAVQNFIQSLRRIGNPSGAGFVWEASFGGIKHVILLKTAKSLALDVSIFHEFFVGTLFTNRLRKYFSQFMFVYGLFKCSRPKFANRLATIASSFCQSTQVIDIHERLSPAEILTLERTEREIERQRELRNYGEVTNLEQLLDVLYARHGDLLDNPVNYLVIENVSGGMSFSDNLKLSTTSFNDVISYIIQLTIALDWALHDHDFCHYDLHTDNVIMRPISLLGQETFVEMSFYGEPQVKRKIYTRYIPTIIDYGRSHVKYRDPETGQDEHYGFHLYPQWGIMYNKSRPAYDIYKLIGFISFEIFKQYRNRDLPPVDYSNIVDRSSSTDNSIKTMAMSMSDKSAPSLLRQLRSITDIEDEVEAVAIFQRIPREIFNNVLSLLFFFPFVREAYADYEARRIPGHHIILFVLREFNSARFSIGNRWPAADQMPLKINLHRQLYDYLLNL